MTSKELEFLLKGKRPVGGSNSASETDYITPNTINVLVATNLLLSSDNKSILVKVNNILLAQLIIREIVSYSISGVKILIISDDMDPVELTFNNASEATSAINFIDSAINL